MTTSDDTAALAETRRRFSSRLSPPRTPPLSMLIHLAVLALWVALFLLVFGRGGILAWSVGLAYLSYDAALLVFTGWHIRRFVTPPGHASPGPPPSVAVLIAAHNEAAVLPATLRALAAQSAPPDEVVIADDGSTDATAEVLCAEFGFTAGGAGVPGPPVRVGSMAVTWIRLAHGGKARALNAAILQTEAEVMLTVDADTLLDHEAIREVRDAFAREPDLVGVTGIITPESRRTPVGRTMQFFQTYEYIRNFLGRYAWMRVDCLQLISGAFAGFRRTAVVDVGGFDDVCLVEDYELVHRLYRYAGEHDLPWRFRVLGAAQARTEAPGSVRALLRQRRRWFGGFLQTQWWYRAMVGSPRMGAVGTLMLPIKAIDAVQPLYGLTAFVLLIYFIVTGNTDVLAPVAVVLGGTLLINLVFQLWSVAQYRRWVGDRNRVSLVGAGVASVVEPFTFRLLLQLGALLGWIAFLGAGQRWGRIDRFGLDDSPAGRA
ncbi:MAG: glycosyltransferase [Actinomycetota bacterium]|nr:glycosyltransferase [Actinomycetota bacterium]